MTSGIAPTNEQQIAADFAAATNAVAQVVHAAAGRAAQLLIDEVEHTDWSKEIAIAVAEVALFAGGSSESVAADGQVRHTLLVALDANGARVSMVHCRDWYGRALLPAVLRWVRETRGTMRWMRKGQPVLVRDGRFALAAPPPSRDAPTLAAVLTSHGWSVSATPAGFNATRAVSQRDWPSLVLVIVLAVALFPVTALVLLYMLVKKVTTGRWPIDNAAVAPWRRADDRLAIDCARGRLRIVRTQAGKAIFDRAYDERSLATMFAESPTMQTPTLSLVEPDRVTTVPLALRGELANDGHRACAEALNEAITAVWMQ
ncbi:MAG: hypothetical protein U0269_33390 [Polyangiales bacterium]